MCPCSLFVTLACTQQTEKTNIICIWFTADCMGSNIGLEPWKQGVV